MNVHFKGMNEAALFFQMLWIYSFCEYSALERVVRHPFMLGTFDIALGERRSLHRGTDCEGRKRKDLCGYSD